MTPERLRERRKERIAHEILRMQIAIVEQNATMHAVILEEQQGYMIAIEAAAQEFNAFCLALSFPRFV